MRRRELMGTSANSNFDLCNVVLYDITTQNLFQTPNISKFSPDKYVPVGVVVIPTSHDVYGDGSCGVLSLLGCSKAKPDTGEASLITLQYGSTLDNAGIEQTSFNGATGRGRDQQVFDYISIDVNNGYAPMMLSTAQKVFDNPNDPKTFYMGQSSNYGFYPSPYDKDDNKSSLYGVSYYETTKSAFSDFSGKENTEKLLSIIEGPANWQTNSNLNSALGSETQKYDQAACAAWRYHTQGTNPGDWYIPACGELGYLPPRMDLINDTLIKISNHFEVPTLLLSQYTDRTPIASSTAGADSSSYCDFWGLNLGKGTVSYNMSSRRSSNNCFRAFYRNIIPLRK